MKKILQYILVSALLISGVQAKVLDATYSVSYGMFGQLGISDAHLETKDDTYVIEVSARTTGIAKKKGRSIKMKQRSSVSTLRMTCSHSISICLRGWSSPMQAIMN